MTSAPHCRKDYLDNNVNNFKCSIAKGFFSLQLKLTLTNLRQPISSSPAAVIGSQSFDNPEKVIKHMKQGREPWSSGYGKRLTFRRSWVRILEPYTGWTFFTYCKNCNVCLKRPKINEKEAGVGPFF